MTIAPSLRAADATDLSFLWDMLYESIHMADGEQKPPREALASGALAHYLIDWGRPGDRALIADVGGRPVGAAWFRLFAADDRGYGYVADDVPELSVAVVPEVRGMGIGSKLLAALIQQAQQEGHRAISLSVDPRNAAVRLYERIGFEYVSTDDGGSWTMVKPLRPY